MKKLLEYDRNRLSAEQILAMAYRANGQVAAAVSLLEHVVTIREKMVAERDPDRLTSQHELAKAYQANGQVREVARLLEHVVAIRQIMLAEDHRDRVPSQHLLAGARFLTNHPSAPEAESIYSGHSLASTANATTPLHPDLYGPGLNVSIVESVSAGFEHGTLRNAKIDGEVVLAYNPPHGAFAEAPVGSELIRLDNFDMLERVHENLIFVERQFSNGYYAVNPSNFKKPKVAFRYQVYREERASLAKHVPLLITPTWRVERTQISAILSYSLNPDFILPKDASSITLSDVTLILRLDRTGAKAVRARTQEGGTFLRKKSLIYWRLGAVTLTPEPEQRMLVRFYTESEGKPGTAHARWKIDSSQGTGIGSGLGVSIHEQHANELSDLDPFADEPTSATSKSEKESWKQI